MEYTVLRNAKTPSIKDMPSEEDSNESKDDILTFLDSSELQSDGTFENVWEHLFREADEEVDLSTGDGEVGSGEADDAGDVDFVATPFDDELVGEHLVERAGEEAADEDILDAHAARVVPRELRERGGVPREPRLVRSDAVRIDCALICERCGCALAFRNAGSFVPLKNDRCMQKRCRSERKKSSPVCESKRYSKL